MHIPRRSSKLNWRLAAFIIALLALIPIAKHLSQPLFERPPLRVAFNRFPPYVDIDSRGQPTGFAVEVFAEAAKRAGIPVRWVEISRSADEAFSQGKADIYPLMTATPEREASFHMSPPWWENQFLLISTRAAAIPDVAHAAGELIATRPGSITTLSRRLFPRTHFVEMLTMPEMENALCARRIDGFFTDTRLLETQLMQRTAACAGQPLSAVTVPGGELFLGTASTKATAPANEKIFRQIARLALDGTLTRAAARWGVFTPYDTGRLKQVVDAETRARRLTWVLIVTLVVLALSVVQIVVVLQAKRAAESARAQAREMHARFDEFMRHTPAITYIKDERQRLVYSNEQYYRRVDPMIQSLESISRRLSSRDSEVFALERSIETTETLRGRDGVDHYFMVLKFPFRNASGLKFLGAVALDVTARIRAERELEQQAKCDILTGLPNRRSFEAELSLALETAAASRQPLAVSFMDLDGFKEVNDTLGHEAGDTLLKEVAARLKHVCRAVGMVAPIMVAPIVVARIGGDEFTFVLPGAPAAAAHQVMTAVLDEMHRPFRLGANRILISASIGVSLFPDHGTTVQQLVRNADSAMYRAKEAGKGRIGLWSPLTHVPAAEPEAVTS